MGFQDPLADDDDEEEDFPALKAKTAPTQAPPVEADEPASPPAPTKPAVV